MDLLSRYIRRKEIGLMVTFLLVAIPLIVVIVKDLFVTTLGHHDRALYNYLFGLQGLIFLTSGILQISKYNADQSQVSKVYATGFTGLGFIFLAEGIIPNDNAVIFIHLTGLLFFSVFISQHLIKKADRYWNSGPYRHWAVMIGIVVLISLVYLFQENLPQMLFDGGFSFFSGFTGHFSSLFLLINAVLISREKWVKKKDIPHHYPLLFFLFALHGMLIGLSYPWTRLWWISIYLMLAGAIFAFSSSVISVFDILMRLRESLINKERAMAQVLESERKYKYVFTNMVDGFARHRVIRDEQGKAVDYVFLEVNPGFERFTGLRADNVIGKRVTEVIPGIRQDPAKWIEVYGDISQTGETKVFESFSKAIDKWYRVTAYSREKDFFTTIFTDVTEQKKQMTELRMAKFKAEESDRIKSAFLANVSHEIRTPLNSIIGFTEILLENEVDLEDKNNYLQIISNSGQRLLTTITDIINISMIESGKLKKEMTEIDPKQLVLEVYQTHLLSAQKKNLELKYKEPGEVGQNQTLISDNNMLYTILSNLVSNAIKYTQEGSVEIETQYKDDRITFFVRDTGIGISQEFIDAIFERFVQEDMSMRRKYEGMGIGLSICKAYTDELGGQIIVESEKGKGSVFGIELPLGSPAS